MSPRPSFVLRLARREFRSSFRRVGPYMISIALGVAALVAIHGIRADVARGIQDQARDLLGSDARLSGSRPLPDTLAAVVDSAVAEAGGSMAELVTVASMVRAVPSGRVRLLQVRGVEGAWPFYGTVTTRPGGIWGRHLEPGAVLVDPAVLTQLGVAPGDTLAVGGTPFRIAGTVEDLPTDLGFQSALAPRVWLSRSALEETGLLGFGSLVRYETHLRLPEEASEELEAGTGEVRREAGIGFTTAREQARDLTRGVDDLGRFLGLVGLGGLLLGGVGVASAVHVFVKEKLTSVAVLRCLGARQNGVFTAYLLQALALGAVGAGAGVVLGLGLQHTLPDLLAASLPVEIAPRLHAGSVAVGLGVGVAVAVLFALLPLLDVRDVPPLRALRRDVEGTGSRWTPGRIGALAVVGAGTTALCLMEAPHPVVGLAFAGALAVTALLLAAVARGLMAVARRALPRRAPYPVRQGISNLFRPRNQTVAVTLALGFGVFVVATLLQVQASVAEGLDLDAGASRPNLVLFDIQPDQSGGVLELLPEETRKEAVVEPVVPGRLVAVEGQPVASLLEEPDGPPRWALNRTYRSTWRPELAPGEEVVAGAWWDDPELPAAPEGVARISVEDDLASDLGVGLGQRITWEIGGREVESVVTSLRSVEWERFSTNFFVVFEPGSVDGAPYTAVALARIPDAEDRVDFQESLVARYPNVSVLDVTRIQEVVEGILSTVTEVIRFLAAFATLAGFLVLAGALATSRAQRQAEGALLKTLGARRRVVLSVLLSEFLALGLLAAAAGLLLATLAAAAVSTLLFDTPFVPRIEVLAGVAGAVTLLTVGVGLLGSLRLLGRPPLPVLREAAEG